MIIRKKTDWSIHEATADRHDQLADFIGKHAWDNAANSRALYRWKYQQKTQGETVALIATNQQNDVVATSMFMPWTLSLDGETIPACQWSDLFVELEYRGQAIADLTLRDGLERTRHAGAHVCFAFPNVNSVPIHKKNKGYHLGHIVRAVKPLHVEYLVRRKVTNPFAAKALARVIDLGLKAISKETYVATSSIQQVETCGAEFDELWRRYSDASEGIVGTRKDKDYLNWKYLQNPDSCRRLFAKKSDGRVDGCVVLESTNEVGYIIDVMAVSEQVLTELIAFSVKVFRREGKQSAAFVSLENNMYSPCLKRFGFVPRPELRHLYLYLGEQVTHADHLEQSKNWFITMGDCDIHHL